MKLNINPEFRDLLNPLTDEEYKGLEKKLLAEGFNSDVYGKIATWNGTIIDGHNRYAICQKHNIEFQTYELDLESDVDAKIWIFSSQVGRRNLNKGECAWAILEKEKMIADKAKANQGKRTDLLIHGTKSKPIDTRKELADMAGVSPATIYRVKKVKESGNQEAIDAMRTGTMSIRKAYAEVMPPKPENQKRVCTSCGKEKKVSEFTNNQTCNECYQDQRSRLKQFSGSELILEEMAKKEPHDGGNGTDLDNQIVTEYMDFIKSVHVQINKYLLCPSLLSGAEIALSDSLLVKKDIETIIDFIKGD